jgi:hypothetical protein
VDAMFLKLRNNNNNYQDDIINVVDAELPYQLQNRTETSVQGGSVVDRTELTEDKKVGRDPT